LLFLVRQCRNGGATNFQTTTITRGPITQAVTATGTLNPVVNVQVGSQVSGNISKLFVDFNSQVKAGQVVAQIDPSLFQAAVTQAEGDLASAQAALDLARLNATRTQELFAKKNSSQQDVDQATATLHQAEANVKIKQGALDKTKADLDKLGIAKNAREEKKRARDEKLREQQENERMAKLYRQHVLKEKPGPELVQLGSIAPAPPAKPP